MKLFYSGNSPYARRLRLVISVFGMADTVSVEDVAPLNTADHVLFKYGPGGRVPALLTDEGDFLCESLIIARYLDEVLDGKLYPTDPAARRFCFRLEGGGSLLMDSLVTREEAKEAKRAQRTYDELESIVDNFGADIDMGQLTVMASLGYADWRHADDNWREGRPKLTAWVAKMMENPAIAESYPNF
ncbi:MAG: glutathione S-transferase family protein [Alphaproteobacteria bacterium]